MIKKLQIIIVFKLDNLSGIIPWKVQTPKASSRHTQPKRHSSVTLWCAWFVVRCCFPGWRSERFPDTDWTPQRTFHSLLHTSHSSLNIPSECSDWSNGKFCLGNYQHDMVLTQSAAHPLDRGRYYTGDPPGPSFCKSTKAVLLKSSKVPSYQKYTYHPHTLIFLVEGEEEGRFWKYTSKSRPLAKRVNYTVMIK